MTETVSPFQWSFKEPKSVLFKIDKYWVIQLKVPFNNLPWLTGKCLYVQIGALMYIKANQSAYTLQNLKTLIALLTIKT